MREPVWVRSEVVHAIHDAQISGHGGADGIRDSGLIESALARPRNIFRYEKHANTPRLAAAYCFSLAKNHGFVDGNKRVAAVVCELFLKLNGYRLSASDAEWLEVMLAVAEGSFDETALTRWLEEHTSAIQSVRS